MNENELEMQYVYCLHTTCPVETKKVRSLCKMVVKGLSALPEKFMELENAVTMFFSYVSPKRDDIYPDEVRDYLAWRIWHFKLSDINRYVINPICKCKAHLVAKKALEELHKSATRIKKANVSLENLLEKNKDNHEIFQAINEIKELVSIQADKALEVYESILQSHKLALNEVNLLITQKINEIPLLGEVE